MARKFQTSSDLAKVWQDTILLIKVSNVPLSGVAKDDDSHHIKLNIYMFSYVTKDLQLR